MYAKSMTVEEASNQMLPMLKGPPVQCALCGRVFNRILPGHLRIHDEYLRSKRGLKWYRPKREPIHEDDDDTGSMSNDEPTVWASRDETLVETYERLFGGKDLLSACVQKILALYQPHRGKWLLMEKPVLPTVAAWHQVSSGEPFFKPNHLCVSILKEHLALKCTVGVFPKSRFETNFVTWDVDAKPVCEDPSWNAPVEAKKAALAISSVLRKWGLHPHVIVSGGKGYHVTVYFRSGASIRLAMQLFHAVLQHPDGPQVRAGLKVECLPIQRGNKLPLGINWGAGRYCSFVDPYTLEPLENPYEYLCDIVPDELKTLYKIEDVGLKQRKHTSTVLTQKSWNKDETEAAFKLGITAPGTRHDTLLRVAAYIRNTPALCPESLSEFEDALLSWSRKQYDEHRHNIGTRWSEHVGDVERVAKYVWGHPLTPGVPRTVRLTAQTVHWIRTQTSVLAEQQIMFAAWFVMAKAGSSCFHFGYQQAMDMTNLTGDPTRKAFKALRAKDILIIEKEYFNGGKGIAPSKTRQYRFRNSPPKSTSTAVLLSFSEKQWEPSLWFRVLRTMFTMQQLKSDYRHSYHRILKAEPLILGRSTA